MSDLLAGPSRLEKLTDMESKADEPEVEVTKVTARGVYGNLNVDFDL